MIEHTGDTHGTNNCPFTAALTETAPKSPSPPSASAHQKTTYATTSPTTQKAGPPAPTTYTHYAGATTTRKPKACGMYLAH